jgi:hypothetical protein
MSKLLRHKWIKVAGFRVHVCEHCFCERFWHTGFQRLMYRWHTETGEYIRYSPRVCKRIMHCDLITK